MAAADDIWLSTAYGRDTAYIAIHQYAGLPYRAYFDRFESIVAAVAGGRTGASCTRSTPRLALYPRFDDFRRVRAEVDPEDRFGNPYLSRVLGPPGRPGGMIHYRFMTAGGAPNRSGGWARTTG